MAAASASGSVTSATGVCGVEFTGSGLQCIAVAPEQCEA